MKECLTIDAPTTSLSGYCHPDYISSLSEYGEPFYLPHSQGALLIRKISGTQYRDAMGAYPLFCCSNWKGLLQDFKELPEDLVTISLVADPLTADVSVLSEIFRDVFIPFKKHYVVDLNLPLEKSVSPRHRNYARRALRDLRIIPILHPETIVDEWDSLYQCLIRKHHITGIKAFSRYAFSRQLKIPGISVFAAYKAEQVIAMQLWYHIGQRAYYHLGASNQMGYQCRASYGLFWFALEYFREKGCLMADLGGNAGINIQSDGLEQFKRGWTPHTRTAYFGGRILNQSIYNELIAKTNSTRVLYFPAYRNGEFATTVRETR